MGLLSLLSRSPLHFFILSGALLYSVIVHEVAHGWMALRFGDTTALRAGRLTLNPLVHIDPLGMMMVLLIGFGWARPVPVNMYGLRHSRLAIVCVAFAGCLANILIAMAAIGLLLFLSDGLNPTVGVALQLLIRINIMLCAFNLLPIPPLDGSKVVFGVLPVSWQAVFLRVEPYGMPILAVLLFTGMLNPLIAIMEQAVYGMIAVVLRGMVLLR